MLDRLRFGREGCEIDSTWEVGRAEVWVSWLDGNGSVGKRFVESGGVVSKKEAQCCVRVTVKERLVGSFDSISNDTL